MSEIKFTSEITVKLVDKLGDDARIAAAAWVSTSAEDGLRRAAEEPDKVPGLISYLLKHRHGTPFESCVVQLYAHAPIFVWREWHRHRIASYNEESARYKQLEPVFYLPPRDRPMMKVDNWKPGRPKFLPCEDDAVYRHLVENLKESYRTSYLNYELNLQLGVDPGLARDCLPVGIYSGCWVTMNLRALMNFLSLRTHDPDVRDVSYPLYEIEIAARQVETLFALHWPLTHAAWDVNGRAAP